MNPFWGLINACNIGDLLYGAIYAIRLLGKGIGPYGNGSWNKSSSGYKKVRDPVTDIQMRRAQTFRSRSDRGNASMEEDAFKFEPIRTQQDAPDVVVTGINGPPSYEISSYGGYDAYRDSSQQDRPGRWIEDREDSYQGSYQAAGQWEGDQDRLLSHSRSAAS